MSKNGLRGVVSINRHGYGFVSGSEGDCLISHGCLMGAMDGDEVDVDVDARAGGRPIGAGQEETPAARLDSDRRRQVDTRRRGRVVRILSRAHVNVIGRYERNGPLGVVSPLDERITYDIFTQAEETPDVKTGAVVEVRITGYPSRYESAQGVIEKVLDQSRGQESDALAIALAHGIDAGFTPAAIEQADALTLDVDRALTEPLRRDLRGRDVITIDPLDAMDFDDALSLERVDGLLRLGVHIADVSAYVPWNTPIDMDARRKATSTYLVGKVLPMLPESLANGSCSLAPQEDRLAMTVDLYLDPRTAEPVRFELFPSVIRSRLRLDYPAVQRMLDGVEPWVEFPEGQRGVDPASRGMGHLSARSVLEALDAVAALRHASRLERGGIDFDIPQTEVRLDDDRRPIEVTMRHRTRATALVEEAMILANGTVARHLTLAGSPMLYRVHGAPSPAALAALGDVLEDAGYGVDGLLGGDPHAIQEILRLAHLRSEEAAIEPLVLRTMRRARYLERLEPHYGLAMDCYTHFTSPIRRYPDLMVHRLLKVQLRHAAETSSPRAASIEALTADLGTIADHCSQMEREADAAATESVRHATALLFARHIGEEYDGVIIDTNGTAAMVRLDNTAECHVTGLGSCDVSDDAGDARSSTAQRSPRALRCVRRGQRVRVRVDEVRMQPPAIECSITTGTDVGVR